MKKLTLSDYQALGEFRFQIRQFLHFSEEAAKGAGLEHVQYQLMLAIKGMPDGMRPRIRDLAGRLHIQHHSAVELIDRLESAGHVQRHRAEGDHREVLLQLTTKGERVLEALAAHHHEQLQSAGPSLVKTLRRLIREKRPRASARERNKREFHEGKKMNLNVADDLPENRISGSRQHAASRC